MDLHLSQLLYPKLANSKIVSTSLQLTSKRHYKSYKKIFFIEVKTRRPTMPSSLDDGGMEKDNKHQERCF